MSYARIVTQAEGFRSLQMDSTLVLVKESAGHHTSGILHDDQARTHL